ncbi:MAG: TetR/AcrR family transcriptional regulator [Candidatus Cloacimonetes bacterium]|nr:TetR/AcrR family transcriptional regulator [Candidatus Cloacimonadota bacterium]
MNQVKIDTILEAANKIFVRYGYQKTSMDDIAREAMIGKGTIYHYFSSKEDIFVAILQDIHKDMNTKLKKKIKKAKTFEDKFKIFLTEPISHFVSNHQLIMQVLNEDSPVFLKKLMDFKMDVHTNFINELKSIFNFGLDHGVFKQSYVKEIDKVIEFIFRWIFLGGEHVKINITEDKIDEIKHDYQLFLDILLNGLILKEEVF